MVANPASVLLDIENDRVFGKPRPASAENAVVVSANLVANSAMGTVSDFTAATVASAEVSESVETQKPALSGLVLESGLIPASPTR
jgi:hypothetical protein